MQQNQTVEAVIRKPKEAYAASDEKSLRQTTSAFRLLLQAAGGPVQWYGKWMRLIRTALTFLNRKEVRRRLDRLQEIGLIEEIPMPRQLAVGGIDMLRYFISPGARDYYESRGIHFGFHQVLRFLDDPVSLIDPIGILSERDTIIGHVLQVVHANPLYDLQILDMFADGVEELEAQTAAMIDGTHPRAKTIGAIVEDPEYHARLLTYLRNYRRDPQTPELRRRADEARSVKSFVLAEETFGALPQAMRYMARLPKGPVALCRHLLNEKTINPAYCDPERVAAVEQAFAA
jgi:hypothetical protein